MHKNNKKIDEYYNRKDWGNLDFKNGIPYQTQDKANIETSKKIFMYNPFKDKNSIIFKTLKSFMLRLIPFLILTGILITILISIGTHIAKSIEVIK